MNNLLENLNRYLDVLDEWEAKEKIKNTSALSFLTKELLVQNIVVSPNLKPGMPGLKTFFASEVLGIYRNKPNAKISYKEIQMYLRGELAKKPRFRFDLLENCSDYVENKSAFLNESRIMKTNIKHRELVEKCDEYIPYILLDELRKTVWKYLNKFNFVCEEKFCEDCKKRKEIYYQFIQSVALFEIFFLEYVQAPIRKWYEDGQILVDNANTSIQSFEKIKGNISEISNVRTEEVAEVAEYVQNLEKIVTKDLDKLVDVIDKISVFSLVEAEFSVELCVMYQLLLVFESINVYKDDIDFVFEINKRDIGLKIDTEMEVNYDKNFKTFGRTNQDRSVSYRRVNVYLENVLTEYAGYNFKVSDLVMKFLNELSNCEKEPSDSLYELMKRLAYPIYQKLGGSRDGNGKIKI